MNFDTKSFDAAIASVDHLTDGKRTWQILTDSAAGSDLANAVEKLNQARALIIEVKGFYS